MDIKVRARTEAKEEALAPGASKSKYSRGRAKWEDPCLIRTDFQRDRDRILHAKAFRRLKHKTQVFMTPSGDHYVTRLTHTLEVSQIARTISRALNLNEDLTEAISLGHDLGHTPFGHVGEEVLDKLYPGGFKHYEQGLRVVDFLENDGQGLNLTWEVRDGILNHSKGQATIFDDNWGEIGTLEGEVCKIADIIAYVNHDTTDAIRSQIIHEAELPPLVVNQLGNTSSRRINTLVRDIVRCSWDVVASPPKEKNNIVMSPPVLEAANALRQFLFEKVYKSIWLEEKAVKAQEIVRFLYFYFLDHPEILPEEYSPRDDRVERKVVDYISGMTDQYALRQVEVIQGIKYDWPFGESIG